MSTAAKNIRCKTQRTGEPSFLLSVFARYRAHNFTEGFGEFTAVVKSAFAGNVKHCPVCFFQKVCRSIHLLCTHIRIHGAAVNSLEAGLQLCRIHLFHIRKLLDSVMLVEIAAGKTAHILCKSDLRLGASVISGK